MRVITARLQENCAQSRYDNVIPLFAIKYVTVSVVYYNGLLSVDNRLDKLRTIA